MTPHSWSYPSLAQPLLGRFREPDNSWAYRMCRVKEPHSFPFVEGNQVLGVVQEGGNGLNTQED